MLNGNIFVHLVTQCVARCSPPPVSAQMLDDAFPAPNTVFDTPNCCTTGGSSAEGEQKNFSAKYTNLTNFF